MKRILFVLLTLPLLLSACSKDDSGSSTPTISFERQAQLLPNGSTSIRLQVTGVEALSQEYIINLQCSGTAAETEYELSSDHFVIGGSNPVTTIQIISKNFSTESKNVVLTLVPPQGVTLGANPSMTITLGPQEQLIYSFVSATMDLKEYVSPEIRLSKKDGTTYSVSDDLLIPAAVDEEKSTAVLGEHFEFVGEPEFVYGKGKLTAPVQLKFLKKEEGKDKIVLKVDPSAAQYVAGDPGECTITIIGSDYFKLEGTWYVYQQYTDKQYFIDLYKVDWGFGDEEFTEIPAATEADTFTFDTEKNVLTTSLQSNLKNFFGETSNMTPTDIVCEDIRDKDDFSKPVYPLLINLDNCNRDFSATSTSADKNAYIGIRMVKEKDTNEDMLELYLLDYHSTSFLTSFEDYYMYNDKRPVATTSGVYMLFYLKKQK